jgi:beta-1,4-mannosyl-glycoprotein beta-1,4-N-acetylglucosaminyltransferase
MKIFDCFMFYDEKTLLDIRLNVLDQYVDYFVIVESKYFHNGKKRELKFNIDDYKKFRNKIIYINHDKLSDKLKTFKPHDSEAEKSYNLIFNAHIRENDQRNKIIEGLKSADSNDLILISDVDEIPNLEDLNLRNIKSKILMFEQSIFYYKLNRYLPNFKWFGTKACIKKNLLCPQWLRNIKSNKYSFYRIDTIFSDTKYINKKYIKNGGWHFSNLKNASDIELKLKSYLHHHDYESEELGKDKIDDLIRNNETIYDMFGDKNSKKYGDDKRKKLEKYEINKLPPYIQNNLNKYKDWID